jgi:hypothetical protein
MLPRRILQRVDEADRRAGEALRAPSSRRAACSGPGVLVARQTHCYHHRSAPLLVCPRREEPVASPIQVSIHHSPNPNLPPTLLAQHPALLRQSGHGHGQAQPPAAAAAALLGIHRRILAQVPQQGLLQDLQAAVVLHLRLFRFRSLDEGAFPTATAAAAAAAAGSPPVSSTPAATAAGGGAGVVPSRRPPASPAPGLQHRQVRLPRRRAEAHRLPVPPSPAPGPRRPRCHGAATAHHGAATSPRHGASAAAADGDTVPPPPHPAAAAGTAAPGAHPAAGPAGALPAPAAPGRLHDRGVAHLRLHAPPPRDALAGPRPDVAARLRVPALAADAAVPRRGDAGHQPPRPRPVTQEDTDAARRRQRRCVDTAGVGWDLARRRRRKEEAAIQAHSVSSNSNLSSKILFSFLACSYLP